MSSLSVTYSGESVKLDEFYKSLLFQLIMDGSFNRDERDVLLVVFRKTIHFDKWDDRLAIFKFSKDVGVCQSKLRQTIMQLEAKGLLEVHKSKGGRTDSIKKYNKFSLSRDLVTLVTDKWIEIKESHGHYL